MKINLYLDNTTTRIEPALGGSVYKEFKKVLGYRPPNYLWMQSPNPNWDGFVSCVCYSKSFCKCAIRHEGMHFPTGLFSLAIKFFKLKNIEYEIFDQRDKKIKNCIGELKLKPNPSFPLYDYQIPVVEKAFDIQRGVIQLCTGAGKTICAANLIARISVSPTIFYVTSIDLLNQAKYEIEKFVLDSEGKNITVGAIGGGYKDIKDITVMTVQTALRALDVKFKKFDEEDENDNTDISDIKDKIKELIESAKMFIADESHHWRSESAQMISEHSKNARWRYALSATPYRDQEDDILIDACFGKRLAQIKASDLIEREFLVQPYITFLPIKNLQGKKLGPYANVYKEAIVENDYRNELIAKLAINLAEKGRNVVVLVQQIAHGETLEQIIPNSKFIHGSSKKKERAERIELMKKGCETAKITIASTILDEGLDCRPLDALILAGGGKSSTRALQRIGRVIRTYQYENGNKKENALIYDFWDYQKYLNKHAASRKKIYLTEPLFKVIELDELKLM